MNKLTLNPCVLPANLGLMSPAVAKVNEKRKDINDLERSAFMRSIAKDPKKMKEFAAARRELVNISVLVDLIASELFQLIPLNADDHIVIQTRKNQEYQVTQVAQPGGMAQKDWQLGESPNIYDVYDIKSDTIIYPVRSIQDGSTMASDEVNRDLQFSYANKIDVDVWTAFTSIFGTFPTGVYDAHSRIASGNLPTTNVINDSSEGAITLQVMKDLLAHLVKAGRRVRTIYISPQDLPDVWDWVSIVSGLSDTGITDPKDTVPEAVREAIFETGVINQLFGYRFKWRTLNFLSSGTMYVTTDQPAGYLYYKPDLEDIMYWSEEECEKHFKRDYSEAVRMKGVIKPLIPSYLYMNAVKVIFTS